jgi:hypothetical protein
MPTLFEPTVIIAVGRVGDPERLEVDTHRTAEVQPRQRRPMRDFVFWGRWDADLDRLAPD